MAPMEKPTPAQPAATGRSDFGNHSPMVLAFAGVAAASDAPIKKRRIAVQPASGTRVEDTHQRPDPGADHKADFQADNVNQPAAQGLANGVGDLERADDPEYCSVVIPRLSFSSGARIPNELRVM